MSDPTAGERTWLVWSHEHNAWWRDNSCGYTTQLGQAGLYTRDEALTIEADANAGGERNEQAISAAAEVSKLHRILNAVGGAVAASPPAGGPREVGESVLDVANEMLQSFAHPGHPGEACLQSGWVPVRRVAEWRAVLKAAAAPRGEAGGPSEDAARVEAALWWRTSPDAKGNHAIPADIVQAAWRVADRALRAAAPAPVGEPGDASNDMAVRTHMVYGKATAYDEYGRCSGCGVAQSAQVITGGRCRCGWAVLELLGALAPVGETPGAAEGREFERDLEAWTWELFGTDEAERLRKKLRVILPAYAKKYASVEAAPASGARETRWTCPKHGRRFSCDCPEASDDAASVPTPVAPPGEEETR